MKKLTILQYPFISLLYLPLALATTCYNPPQNIGTSGTAQDSTYTPCNITQQVSMCCRTIRSAGAVPADTCLTNGLCQNIAESGATPTYWRESCTDPTWKSPFCLGGFDVCSMDQNSNAQITLCPGKNSTYCCGDNNTACCDTEFAISVSGTVERSETSTGMGIAIGTSSPAGTATATSTPTSTLTSSVKPGMSTGAKSGIALGSVAVVLFAVTALLSFLGKRKKNKKEKVAETTEDEDKGILLTVIERPVPHFEFSGNTPDLHSYAGTWELPDRNIEAKELDTNVSRRI